MPKLSFVLLNWNSDSYLRRCMAALAQQTTADFEVIAVDNGSTNESWRWLQAAERDGTLDRVIRLPENRGFSTGMNVGIAAASGDLIVPLNSDVCVGRNFVEAVLRAAAAAPSGTGMFAVPVHNWYWDEQQDHLSDDLHTVGVSLVRRLSVSAWHPAFDPPEQLLGPEGTAPVFTRQALEAARSSAGHVYDERYVSFGEDIDLYLRLHALGVTCTPVMDTSIWHVGSASAGGVRAFHGKAPYLQDLVQRNRLRNFFRIGGRSKWLQVLPWVVLDDVYRVVTVDDRARYIAMLSRSYGGARALALPQYPPVRLPFAGGAFSRSGRYRRRYGALPPLPGLDLQRIVPAAA
jgi:GT2 family glycosyltransferase